MMASPAAVAADPDALLRNPVGTGPYRFVEWVPGDQIVVERNDDYWGGAPPLDEIMFKLFPVESARIAAFEAGELDAMISGIDETAAKDEANGEQVVSPPPTGYTFLLLNQTRPPFDDVRVRQALTIASDRDAVASAYQGQLYADFAWSPFVKGTKWWAAPETPTRASTPTPPAHCSRTTASPWSSPPAPRRQPDGRGRRAGPRSSTAPRPGSTRRSRSSPDLGTYVTKAITGDFDMAGWIVGSFGDPDGFLYNQLHTGRRNYGKYANPEMDALLEPAASRPIRRPASRSTTRSRSCSAPMCRISDVTRPALHHRRRQRDRTRGHVGVSRPYRRFHGGLSLQP